MQIVCPHCTTSYAVNPATFGSAGRTVRCARCKQTWLAYPEEAAASYALAPASGDAGSGWGDPPLREQSEADMPVVDSPSIMSDMPGNRDHDQPAEDADWTALARHAADDLADEPRSRSQVSSWVNSWVNRLGLSALSLGPLARGGLPISLPTACAAMGAVALGLVIWRADIVRLMPQTATFFKLMGMGVNLRGLAFEDVRISTELVDNKPVLIIEGNIVDVAKKPVEIPRLRFQVRDAHGTEIYAWNAVLEQSALQPGEKAWFRSRLASPPAEGREIAVRFFSRRDLVAGGA
jgi:predicted Zn finger-like uncharacterized protein